MLKKKIQSPPGTHFDYRRKAEKSNQVISILGGSGDGGARRGRRHPFGTNGPRGEKQQNHSTICCTHNVTHIIIWEDRQYYFLLSVS